MYLDRTYRPRRRRRGLERFWPLILLGIVGIFLYEQQPNWMIPQETLPTPIPTRSAISFLAEAERLVRSREFDAALASYEEVARLEPQNPDPLVEQARLYIMLRDIKKSRTVAERAVQVAPESPNALSALARALDWLGEYDLAFQYAFDALEHDPNHVPTLAVLGEIYTDVGRRNIAQGHLENALELAPQDALVLRNLAYLSEINGEYEQAIAYYNAAIEAVPHQFDLHIEKARQYGDGLQDYEQANASYKAAVEVYESAVTLDAFGFGLYNIGDYFQALRELRKAVEHDPNYGPAQVHLGMTLYARLNYEEAVIALERGVALLGDATRVEHLYTLGLGYLYKEPRECEKAIPWLQKALELEPQSRPALEGLSLCSEH